MNLVEVIDQLVEEKGLDKTLIQSIICEGMAAAYQKKFPEVEFLVEYDNNSSDLLVYSMKTVVSSVKDEDKEVSLRKARAVLASAELGQTIPVPFDGTI